MDSDWVSLPCIYNNNQTLDVHIRVSLLSFARIWKESGSDKIDNGSTALYFRGNKKPLKVVLPIADVFDLIPGFIPFTMANKEPVIINPEAVCYYRNFIDTQSNEDKYYLSLNSVGDNDSFFIVTTNPEMISSF